MKLSNGEGSELDYCIRDGLAASEATGSGVFKPLHLGLLAEALVLAG